MRKQLLSRMHTKSLLGMALCIACHWANAQAVLPVESGKVLFYDVVQADSASMDLLFQNAHQWLASHSFASITDSVTSDGHKLTATHQFPVYATGYISKKQNGVVTYTLQIEVKHHKYRYWFTNFVFHYYHENRNYQLVATGKTKPLEEQTASGWQKTWEYNRKTTQQVINSQIEDLKKDIVQPPAPEKAETVQKKEW